MPIICALMKPIDPLKHHRLVVRAHGPVESKLDPAGDGSSFTVEFNAPFERTGRLVRTVYYLVHGIRKLHWWIVHRWKTSGERYSRVKVCLTLAALEQ